VHSSPDAQVHPSRDGADVIDPHKITNADELLRHLATADRSLSTISGEIRYVKHFTLEDSTHERVGKVFVELTSPTQRRAAVQFVNLILDGVQRDEDQQLIVDGRWLTEFSTSRKQRIRRELAREGDSFDPLRMGEGPVPLPLGQTVADIHAQYTSTLAPATVGLDVLPEETQEAMRAFVASCYQVALTPKLAPERADDLAMVRIWYKKPAEGLAADDPANRLQPRLALTIDKAGNVSTVQLLNLRLNQPIATDVFAPKAGNADEWEDREELLP
jgi:hypothetical protein